MKLLRATKKRRWKKMEEDGGRWKKMDEKKSQKKVEKWSKTFLFGK